MDYLETQPKEQASLQSKYASGTALRRVQKDSVPSPAVEVRSEPIAPFVEMDLSKVELGAAD